MWITDEAMQEYDYDYAQFRAIDGIDNVERFVSLNDWENAECVHANGEWTDTFQGFNVFGSFQCTDCHTEIRVR